MRGTAKNTPENRAYLSGCEAVRLVKDENPEVLMFSFDPAKVPEAVPAGIYFDLSVSPF